MSEQSHATPLTPVVGPRARYLTMRTAVRATVCTLCVAVLAGCSLVPAYQRPSVPLAQSFDGAAGGSLADTVPVRSGWWREYHDPALDALVERSLSNNLTLASAIASVEQARGNAQKAGAPQYPSLTLGATFDRGHQGRGSTTKSQSLFAEASYEVDFWGFNAANASAADLLARASAFDRDTVALTLTASVTDTYFQVQSLRRRLAIARSISDDAEHILLLLLAQQQAGVATELQVQQQRNALATFQAAVPALQQQLDTSIHALAVLAGTAPEQFTVRDAALADIPIPQPRPNLPASLLETRPDIRSKEAQLQSANQSVGAARAAFLPNIVLTADGGLSSRSLSQFLSSPFASLATSLTAPIFDGGALRGQLHASQAAEAKGVADYQQAVVTALQDVEDSLTAAQQQQLAEAADQNAADAARKAATLAQAQYRLGTVDFLTVLDAQRTLFQAQDTLVQARLARLQASVSLFRAFGGGFGVTDSTASSSTRSRS
ncbi:putative efflux pump outer membrane protein TtgC [Paraburkholderia ultramafica]|uniref:Putative efflux pump outer membrane protein TtgC n=1 Tax=Paraburkholderia ultramafica TaxID=1544867 RepID=A0A6S7BR97_9BURK|nr:efflux transporter outer membrane subunit [Paraburkholderia ultramafica]CAB3809692.1 putative efflux pump outer membrane protein TtgC [Paraburkholderia ultramafica]